MVEIVELVTVGVMVAVYVIAYCMYSPVVKKIYGGRMTSSIPYFLMAIAVLAGMFLIEGLEVFYPALDSAHFFHFSLQVMQLLAGLFFISALYNLYQTSFALGGFK